MKRKIYNRLLNWKETQNGQTAILIDGARRVGKSYIVEEFARKEYKSFVLIDFSKEDKQLKQLFEDPLSALDVFFRMLSLLKDVKLYPRKSIVVFDEVQQYPLERQPSLKAKGRLLRIGPDKGGHWEVAERYAILVKV